MNMNYRYKNENWVFIAFFIGEIANFNIFYTISLIFVHKMFTKCALFGFKCRGRDQTTILKKNYYYNLIVEHLISKTVISKTKL